jgi:hypothetical protein
VVNNLFVSFELRDLTREGSLVLGAIEELGQAVRISYSSWYVRSTLAASEAASRVWGVMREEDRLLVVDASNNEAAMFNLDARASRFIADRWHLDTSLSERRRSRMSSMDESAAATQKAREDTA